MRMEKPQCNFQNCKYHQDGNCVSEKEFNRCAFDEYRHLYAVSNAERERELQETAELREENANLKKSLRVELAIVEQQSKRISELVEENERLRTRVKAVEEGAVRSFESQQDLYRKMCEALNREKHEAVADTVRKMSERLKLRVLEENHLRTQAEEMLALGMNEVKADTVRKMSERLKKELYDFYNSDEEAWLDISDLTDQIAKEMLEGL